MQFTGRPAPSGRPVRKDSSENVREALIQLRGIEKRFGAKVALDKAELRLGQGEILGLVGDNGAGKSTMLKILSGVLKRDAGEVYLDGNPVRIDTPIHSRDLGIEMVYQDLSLCGSLNVWENVFLGRYRARPPFAKLLAILDKKRMALKALGAMEALGINRIEVNTPVRNLSGGQQQAVAICRCLLFEPRVILLDEPTASMALREREKVLGLIKSLSQQGKSIIMVTHNLQELFKVANRAAVLKEGRTIWQGSLDGISPDDVARMMFVGRA